MFVLDLLHILNSRRSRLYKAISHYYGKSYYIQYICTEHSQASELTLMGSLNKRQRKLKGQSRMDNLEKTEGAIKNGQSKEYWRGIQEWTIQRKLKGQSKMDNPEKTEGAIKNEQSREN